MTIEDSEIERYAQHSLPTLRDIFGVLFRQRRAMLTVFILVIIAAAVSGMWIPKYEAEMKILVRRERSDAMVTPSANAPAQFSGDQVSEEDLNSEVELLNSEDLLRRVVLKAGISGKSGAPADRESEVRIATEVRELSEGLKIQPIRKANVISVKYRTRDPQMAAEVLKALAVAYTEKHLEVHRPSGEFKFFDQQTEQYHRGLEQAQKQLIDFTRGTGVVSAQLERDAALQRANEFDSTAHQAQATVAETEQRIRVLREQLESLQPRMTTAVRTSDNPQLLQQFKSTLLNLELKRTELLTKYEPTYQLVQEVDQQIADAKKAISAEESKPVREETTDQNPNYQWIRAELTKGHAELSGLKARAETASSIAGQYREAARHLDEDGVVQQDLLRAAKTQEDNYLLYVRKSEEARISDVLDQRGILNVAMAEQPMVPALPSRSPLSAAIFTLLLAVTASLSAAFVVDIMDPSFRTPDELANFLDIPVLAVLPKGGD
jgi:uncharacterized protein involved in exopolysaccharide biosynthesis